MLLNRARKVAERWPITLEMIDDMEALLGPAAELFKAAKTRAAEMQRAFEATFARRNAEDLERQRDATELAACEAADRRRAPHVWLSFLRRSPVCAAR
ncbi:hypothetical protein P3T16_006578 [Paraburkholderia sp. GAS42]